MLETKFGLKYPFPHVLIHIVDNSSYTGELGVLTADDPSLYGTIVVVGTPLGEDRKMINVTRSDVLNVAFGLGNLATSDIQKYGQTITYPLSLIEQGAPVKLMRVTPDDACYAYSCVTVEWRWIPDEQKMHVRYNTLDNATLMQNRSLANYSNKERLNAAIVKAAAGEVAPAANDPYQIPWKRRAFMVNISAGRGSAYNVYSTMINQTVQGKRPANVRYMFSTYDTTRSVYVEQYFASLINENNGDRDDAVECVNVAMKRRVDGSSVVVNFVNEAAIRELYNEYRANYQNLVNMSDGTLITDYQREVFTFMNINTFDPIFGLYIYGGTDEAVKLPFFQVDMRSADIQMLPASNCIYTTEENKNAPQLLNEKLLPMTKGVNGDGSTTYVGDVYLYSGTSSMTNPFLYVVTGVNQFSGAITTIRTNSLLNNNNTPATLSAIFDVNAITDDITAALKRKLDNGSVHLGDIIAKHVIGVDTEDTNNTSWKLFVVNALDSVDELTGDIYSKINWDAVQHSNLVTLSTELTPPAGQQAPDITIGSTYIDLDDTASKVYVVPYTETPIDASNIESKLDELVEVTAATKKYGAVPSNVSVDADVIGTEFDVFQVSEDDFQYYQPKSAVTSGSGFSQEQLTYMSTVGTDRKYAFESYQYTLLNAAPSDWADHYKNYFVKTGSGDNVVYKPVVGSTAPEWTADTYYIGQKIVSLLDGYATSEGAIRLQQYSTKNHPFINYGTDAEPNRQDLDDIAGTYRLVTKDVAGYYKTEDGKFYSDAEYTTELAQDNHTRYFDQVAGDYYYLAAADAFQKSDKFVKMVVKSASGYTDDSSATEIVKVTNFAFTADDFTQVIGDNFIPKDIVRYMVTGSIGSIFRVQEETTVVIPNDYYSNNYGINITSNYGGVKLHDGYTGFFDDALNDIEFKWRYSQLLVRAYRGQLDPRIMSPVRCAAKYLFDGGTNTIVGQTVLPSIQYTPAELINASTIFTADEKDEIMLHPNIITWDSADIDVKAAMYDLMVYRCYYGMPESKRPLGPGYGLSLHLDGGMSDSISATAINNSFLKRFDNPNGSWDIGGYVSSVDGNSYTFVKRIADNLTRHCKSTTVNKPFTGNYTMIRPTEYLSFFPDLDVTDWDYRELLYNAGGNVWVPDVNGNLVRKSQRTLMRSSSTSDLLQESNMRTLSQLCYLLQNKLEEKLFEYTDDSVLKTISDEVNNMFSNWAGNLVESLQIEFARDIDPIDGGEVVVCYVNVTFRGITLRIPVIVNVNRRSS